MGQSDWFIAKKWVSIKWNWNFHDIRHLITCSNAIIEIVLPARLISTAPQHLIGSIQAAPSLCFFLGKGAFIQISSSKTLHYTSNFYDGKEVIRCACNHPLDIIRDSPQVWLVWWEYFFQLSFFSGCFSSHTQNLHQHINWEDPNILSFHQYHMVINRRLW